MVSSFTQPTPVQQATIVLEELQPHVPLVNTTQKQDLPIQVIASPSQLATTLTLLVLLLTQPVMQVISVQPDLPQLRNLNALLESSFL